MTAAHSISFLFRPARTFGFAAIAAACLALACTSSGSGEPEPPAFEVGDVFSECPECPDMVVLPAGTFMMGAPEDDPNRRPSERLHEVRFPRAFALARTAVTWDQWEACVADGWCDGEGVDRALRTRPNGEPNPNFDDWGRGTRPMVGVSWFDAQTFVGWLNWKAGTDGAYRLPSDAEWEYAVRAGTTTVYWWGDEIDHDFGNFGGTGAMPSGKAEGRDIWVNETAPVASFPPNPWGLYDMPGNVFEWVEDCFEEDRANAPDDGSANLHGNCDNRVFRNGTFLSSPLMQRSARRGAPYPATQRGYNYLGFRVARTLEP